MKWSCEAYFMSIIWRLIYFTSRNEVNESLIGNCRYTLADTNDLYSLCIGNYRKLNNITAVVVIERDQTHIPVLPLYNEMSG